jgi:hypothetical protein
MMIQSGSIMPNFLMGGTFKAGQDKEFDWLLFVDTLDAEPRCSVIDKTGEGIEKYIIV